MTKMQENEDKQKIFLEKFLAVHRGRMEGVLAQGISQTKAHVLVLENLIKYLRELRSNENNYLKKAPISTKRYNKKNAAERMGVETYQKTVEAERRKLWELENLLVYLIRESKKCVSELENRQEKPGEFLPFSSKD